MSVTAAASGFVVLLLTVTVVQCENGWDVSYTSTEICAVRGSTVDITCTYTYPSTFNNHDTTVQETFWFIQESNGIHVDLRTDPEYSGRVEYLCGNNKCTLRISNLRESDSAVYKFRFTTNQPTGSLTGSAGVTLSVTDLHVQVSRSVKGDSRNWAELRCQSSCRLPDHLNYVWYKNQQKKKEGASYSDYFYSADRVSCAVKGHEDFRSPSMLVQCENGWDVSYTSTEICAVRGSTVDITCTYTYPSTFNNHDTTVQETFWFIQESNGIHVDLRTDPEYSGRVEYLCENNKCTLRISNLTESDSAVYKFRFTTNQPTGSLTGSAGVTLSVTDPQLQVHVRRSTANPYSTWTELTCHSRCQLPDHLSYVWYNNNKLVGRKKYFHLQHFNAEDSYHCAIEGHERFPSPTLDAPKVPSVSVSPSGEIMEGSSVTLTCSSDANPAAHYTWYKEDEDSPKASGQIFTITNITAEHGGNYRLPNESEENCDLHYASVHFMKSQTDPIYSHVGSAEPSKHKEAEEVAYASVNFNRSAPRRSKGVSVSPSGEIMEGSSVTLTCSSDANPAAKYTWYKRSGDKEVPPLSEETQFVLSSIWSSDSGEYYCTAENELGRSSANISITVTYAPKVPSVSVSPSGEIMEGSSVTLTCSSDANPAANYTWYKENRTLLQGPEGVYRLSSISSGDSGVYSCKSENQYGRINSTSLHVDVQYAPQSSSVSVSPSGEIMEGSSVTLTCSSDANPAANYTWYKENRTLLQGPEGVYRLSSISSGDSGVYSCKSENQYGRINSTSLHLDVQYAPKPPSVSVSPSGEIMEGSSVTLTCSSDANPEANYTWSKEDEDSPKASGQIFTITDITAEHGGNYQCEAQNTQGRSNATLHLTVAAVSPGSLISALIGSAAAVFLAVTLLSVFLLIRRKRNSQQSADPGDRLDHSEQRLPNQSEENCDLHYASVHFMKRQTDPIYSNVGSAEPSKHKEAEEVAYASVNFNRSAPRTRGQDTGEDPAALYSTVKKPPAV
ncbi:B-cell receptor CD22-like [Hippoglossus stenolepis]|uniref:B-cell receptor CD22-like n=1 Tax=Hippoglossus stenolepis TaxID=195615 RepID=UPI001FAF46DD|nr:B-cell receptor CD22-like [Hippoglossus stenolepis]